ncbi:hypothetical protein J4573_33060 [Actinomadura barringtoniae]|uniref:Nuclear transport factor 2 family protein n=1 Tax=Actinomadura barringtoniae TaxID=1427535 RepID=A0A939T6H8_9ACTN|nr:hypothetical protein [Actinomadura barringtoniae]MBO2451958.1 hypothetical protein [Actinomadura barringtoniae]
MMDLHLTAATAERIAERYLAVWSEPDAARRLATIKELWAEDGVEYVEEAEFRGHAELDARIAQAYEAFVGSGRFTVTPAGDVRWHHDVITMTVHLTTPSGESAWAARAVLIIGADDLIRQDYQFVVQELAE